MKRNRRAAFLGKLAIVAASGTDYRASLPLFVLRCLKLRSLQVASSNAKTFAGNHVTRMCSAKLSVTRSGA